ncbi:GGDEF domain-containing protein [Granulosicoccaceae sp. 1_MG-2023]|nr:GGDEF domain-containing protein [Granulosicoccaceae sp. 1_MG-2023]
MVMLPDVFEQPPTPNSRLVSRVFRLRKLALLLSLCISMSVLLAGQFPALSARLPGQWITMAPATATGVALLSLILLLCPHTSRHAVRFPYLAAVGFTLLYSLYAIAQGFTSTAAADATQPMTLIGACYMTLLSLFLLVVRCKSKRTVPVSDILAYVLLVLLIAVTSASVFSSPIVIGSHSLSALSLPTLICFYCLFIAILPTRASRGWFSPIFGDGIGSHVSRLVLPFTLATPFVVILSALLLSGEQHNPLPQQFWTLTLIVTVISGASALLVFPLARRVNALERGLRELSLNDEMTSVLNRRGFFLLGEHLYSQALRENSGLGILFFDLDGLKKVNDTYGHDTGSALLVDFARLLKSTFRHSDAIGRIGGDEFAVVSCRPGLDNALKRLHTAVAAFNAHNKKHYRIDYSVGRLHAMPGNGVPFDSLLAQADLLMYKEKRRRKQQAQETHRTAQKRAAGAVAQIAET